MKILIIGDQHIDGYGLSAGQLSFVGHFVRQISRTRRTVSVETYVRSTLSSAQATLAQLPLEQYDLLIIQTGQGCIDHPAGFGSLFVSSASSAIDLPGELALPTELMPIAVLSRPDWQNQLRTLGQVALLRILTGLGALPRIRIVWHELMSLLNLLHPYRHKVLLISPIPQRQPVSGWLREQGRLLILNEGNKRAFSVFDTNLVIQPRDEYFLPDKQFLNAVGHELVGRALFDFFLAAPTTVAIHSIRRS